MTLSQGVLRKGHLICPWLVTSGEAVCEALESIEGEKWSSLQEAEVKVAQSPFSFRTSSEQESETLRCEFEGGEGLNEVYFPEGMKGCVCTQRGLLRTALISV